jgi:predicted esterase
MPTAASFIERWTLSVQRWTFCLLFFLLTLLSPLALAKAPELPADLLPRDTLEKLYRAELPHYNPADYQKLYDAHVYLEKYFLTDSAEDRQAITRILEKSGIPPATLGRMCRIHLAWPALPPGPAYVNERIGPHDVQYFLGIPANYDRAKAWPLVIRLPAANAIITDIKNPPKPDDVVHLYTQWVSDELKAHPDAVVVMPLLNLDELYGPSYKGMDSVIEAMHHVSTRVDIDPTRVYMLGHGMAGHATWNLALHFPTYFAAINPLAGAASADWQRVRLLNLKNILCVVWADTTDKIINSNQSAAIVGILRNMKYDVDFDLTRKFGHTPTPEIAEKCYQTMRARKRALYPQQVNLRSNRPDPIFNRIDWVQVYQPLSTGKEKSYFLRRGTGKITVDENALSVQAAFTAPNKIEARTENVQTLRFYFNDQMVDLAKPVTVIINGKTRFEGMVTPSLDEMLKDQIFLGRGWRYFTAVLDIDLAPRGATGAASRPTSLPAVTASRVFFTTDEGKTLFPIEAATRPPFVRDGKQAVRAHVYTCDRGKTSFVAYLSKFSPVAQEALVKRPGMTQWFPLSSPGAALILQVKCPEGSVGKSPVEIFPKEGAEQ